MTDAGNRILGSQMAMRQNGVAGAVLVGTKHIFAARDHDAVVDGSTAFRMQNVIVTVLFVQVRSLRPNGFALESGKYNGGIGL